MHILHGTWIPQSGTDFIKSGTFYVWVETTEKKCSSKLNLRHPRHLAAAELSTLLTSELKITPPNFHSSDDLITPCYFLEEEASDSFELRYWQIDCYPTLASTKVEVDHRTEVNTVIPLLNDLHFTVLHHLSEIQLGADLLFWFHFTQALKRIICQDQYIPALKYRELEASKTPISKKRSGSKPSLVKHRNSMIVSLYYAIFLNAC